MSLTSNSNTPELYIKYDKKGRSGGKNPSGTVASLNSQPTGNSTSAILPPPTSHIMKASIKKKNKVRASKNQSAPVEMEVLKRHGVPRTLPTVLYYAHTVLRSHEV